MPLYEYHCPSCRSTFELLRPMRDADASATCPSGHRNAVKVLSLVAQRPRDVSVPASGGCACGGNCGCAG